MRRNLFTFLIVFTAFFTTQSVWAESVFVCPDLSKAKQVGDCPTEADLKRYFKSTCGWANKPGKKKPDLCDSIEGYKLRKNIALWESGDQEFMGYLTCNTPPAEIKAAKSVRVAVSERAGIYKVACGYEGGLTLTYRTRMVCKIPGAEPSKSSSDCGPDAASCKVVCE